MATKTLQELQAEQETIDGRYSIAAKNWAAGEFDPEGVVTVLERAEEAELNAANSASVAYAAAGRASTAETNAGNAEVAAVTASGTAETARGAAVEAAAAAVAAKNAAVTASEEAVDKVAGAAQVDENNTFTKVNTFNGVSVFNGASTFEGALSAKDSLSYEDQELDDLLSYPVAARLMEAGINPASATARSWNEWEAMNPNWRSLPSLLFYAPLIRETLPAFTGTAGPFAKCIFISPASVNNLGAQVLQSNDVSWYTLNTGTCKDIYNWYNVKKCSFYAPKVTKLDQALNATGYLNSSKALELTVYAPELNTIAPVESNSSFWRIGLLNKFSIYAPKLASSFPFSVDTHGLGGQTCEILQTLIDGIGTPPKIDPVTGLETEPQTIKTLYPSDGDEIVEGETRTKFEKLKAAAAAKHWKFISKEGTDL